MCEVIGVKFDFNGDRKLVPAVNLRPASACRVKDQLVLMLLRKASISTRKICRRL